MKKKIIGSGMLLTSLLFISACGTNIDGTYKSDSTSLIIDGDSWTLKYGDFTNDWGTIDTDNHSLITDYSEQKGKKYDYVMDGDVIKFDYGEDYLELTKED